MARYETIASYDVMKVYSEEGLDVELEQAVEAVCRG